MIGRLRGTLLEMDGLGLVVDVGGVGYAVSAPLSSLPSREGDQVDLYIHTDVREDAIQLFGFSSRAEREVFRKLTTVHGVGPTTALAILSGLPLPDLVATVQRGDVNRLKAIPRVGQKTAERICLELREKLAFAAAGPHALHGASGAPRSPSDSLLEDAVAALENLGYKSQNARAALEQVRASQPDGPLEVWLRTALKLLSP